MRTRMKPKPNFCRSHQALWNGRRPRFKTANSRLQICVHGDFSFGTSVAALTRASSLNGHHMEVKWARKEQDLSACQILFVSRSAAKRYDKTLNAVKNSITLTIGEDANFLQAGGMLSLQSDRAGVLFDVNLDAVNELRGAWRMAIHPG